MCARVTHAGRAMTTRISPPPLFPEGESDMVGLTTGQDGALPRTINYGQLMYKALRQLMAEVLSQIARDGLPGDHHFFISFDTTHPGVDMSVALRERYPEEMTIVLQDWFEGLAVMKDRFTVTLNFGNVAEPIVVPFEAVKTFIDPSVEFGLRFEPHEDEADDTPDPATPPDDSPETPDEPADKDTGKGAVVSLDQFRKP